MSCSPLSESAHLLPTRSLPTRRNTQEDEGPFGEGTITFQSSAPGKGCDNPKDTMGLNEVQVARAVRARFLATSNFTVEMAAWQVAYELNEGEAVCCCLGGRSLDYIAS